jgi:hypothetical protein
METGRPARAGHERTVNSTFLPWLPPMALTSADLLAKVRELARPNKFNQRGGLTPPPPQQQIAGAVHRLHGVEGADAAGMVFRRCGLAGQRHLRFGEAAGEGKVEACLRRTWPFARATLRTLPPSSCRGGGLLEGAQGYQESLFSHRISDIERFRSFVSPRVGARRAGLLSLTLASVETSIFT